MILIKGIDLPKNGCYLDLVITDDGVVRYYGDKEEMQIAKAVELPDHGRLIYADALKRLVDEEWFDCREKSSFFDEIDRTPTI